MAYARKSLLVWDQTDAGMNAAWASVPAVPGDPSKGSLRDRVKASVIPVSADIPLSGVRYVLAKVEDPLVNKFPGDWNVTVGITPDHDPAAADKCSGSKCLPGYHLSWHPD